MKVYVLKSLSYILNGTEHWDGYYTGDTYVFQGEKYAVCETNIKHAKIYFSPRTAQRGCEILNEKVVNYLFCVKEIEYEKDIK